MKGAFFAPHADPQSKQSVFLEALRHTFLLGTPFQFTWEKVLSFGAGEMAHWIKVPAAKPWDLSSGFDLQDLHGRSKQLFLCKLPPTSVCVWCVCVDLWQYEGMLVPSWSTCRTGRSYQFLGWPSDSSSGNRLSYSPTLVPWPVLGDGIGLFSQSLKNRRSQVWKFVISE